MGVRVGTTVVAARVSTAAGRAARIIALLLVLTACRLPYIPALTSGPPAAVTRLTDATGRVVGQAVLLQQDGGVRILIDLTGVTPGTRAVHIHEVGRCDPPSFESAGAHFNPTKAQHGTANPKGPHAGDLPDITVEANGRGHLEVTATRITLEKGSALFDADGSAIVVHDRPDDMRTDPAGDSGARLACGVIVRGS